MAHFERGLYVTEISLIIKQIRTILSYQKAKTHLFKLFCYTDSQSSGLYIYKKLEWINNSIILDNILTTYSWYLVIVGIWFQTNGK